MVPAFLVLPPPRSQDLTSRPASQYDPTTSLSRTKDNMNTFRLILLAILGFLGLSIALPQPHTGMVDTDALRDVGVIYTKPDFKGGNKFIFEVKAHPECLPLNSAVYSAKICKSDVACTFYTGGGCIPNAHNYGVRIGCGDVQNVKTPVDSFFTYYTCGHGAHQQPANLTLATTPHDPSKDGVMMRT